MDAKPSLTINKRINAPRAKIYAAWTDPALLGRWFGGGPIADTKAELNVRPGENFRIIMTMQNGEVHDVSGTYREVVPEEKLVFTWAWRSTPERQSLVSVLFKNDGAATLLTLVHEQFFDEVARDRHNYGWTQSFEKLAQLFNAEEK